MSISKEQSLGLLGMAQSTNLDTLGSVEVTAAAAARIAHNTAEDLLSTRTLDLKGRRNLVQVLEVCGNAWGAVVISWDSLNIYL